MTTGFRYDFVKDVSQRNGVLVVSGSRVQLSAGVWTTSGLGSVATARLSCLKHVLNEMRDHEVRWERWVVVGLRALQPNTRLRRYLGLRNYLQRQQLKIPSTGFFEESREFEGGLRFTGAARWEPSDLEDIHALMMAERAVIILANAKEAQSVVVDIVHQGWAMTHINPPPAGLDVAAHHSIVVVDAFGGFDDPDVAVAAIGRGEVLAMFGLVPVAP